MKKGDNRTKVLKKISRILMYSFYLLLVIEGIMNTVSFKKNITIKLCYLLIIIAILHLIVDILRKRGLKDIISSLAFVFCALFATSFTYWSLFL